MRVVCGFEEGGRSGVAAVVWECVGVACLPGVCVRERERGGETHSSLSLSPHHTHRGRTGRHVLGGVADQGEEDDADDRLADAVRLGHAVDGVHLRFFLGEGCVCERECLNKIRGSLSYRGE